MTTIAATASGSGSVSSTASDVSAAVLDTIVGALANGDFDRIASAMADDVSLRAVLPRGLCEWEGALAICDAFTGWFGGLDERDVTYSRCEDVGGVTHLQWRLRVRGERLGDGPRVVEQHVFAHFDPEGRIASMALMCSGFQIERADG
jgi:ketosteroid isomerase-like protein